MVRTLGELGEEPRRRQKRSYRKAPEYRECHYCGRRLFRGMGKAERGIWRCRKPCTLWPVTIGEADDLP